MLKATDGLLLPTTIIGSLPRPSWYTENLGTRSFLDAMVDIGFREQYVDALSVYLREQELAGLDIVTDGDCRFDHDVGGQSWTRYPTQHMAGFEHDQPAAGAGRAPAASAFPRGHILHDYLEARVMPRIVGPVGRGELQYAEMWKAAQRLTTRPVKFGTVTPELVAFAVQDSHYEDLPSRIMAISDALNEELHDLADAGCPVIQMEEPQIHLLAARGHRRRRDQPRVHGRRVQQHGQGLARQDRGLVPHLLGQPVAAADVRHRAVLRAGPRVPEPGRCRRHHVRDPQLGRRGPRPRSARRITDKRIGIGVIDHHTLQVESPEEVAELRAARARAHPGRAARRLLGLRHGPRGHEPAPRVLQDGLARARARTSSARSWACPRPSAWRPIPRYSLISDELIGEGRTMINAAHRRARLVGQDARRVGSGPERRRCASSPAATRTRLAGGRRRSPRTQALRLVDGVRGAARRSRGRRGRARDTATRSTRSRSIAAAEAGKHVFCEKPFTLTKARGRGGGRRGSRGRRHARPRLQPPLPSRDDEAARADPLGRARRRSCTSRRR